MTVPLLSTKLFLPPPRPNRVQREHLTQRLNCGLEDGQALILVSASAGFGKTSLVSAWLRQLERAPQVAWLSLDGGDNDPLLFLRYLIAGLQKVDPTFGEALQPWLVTTQLPPLQELGTLLVNEVARIDQAPVLILDDYHCITSSDIHALVQMLVEYQPGDLHIVLITREDPPFPLPRLRAKGMMTEIRERDLRFTQSEAETFFSQSMGLDLPSKWVALLEAQTEGWVAGLQLAALAIKKLPDEHSTQVFVETFAGTDRYVLDYLLDEVYTRQPAEIQDFLLRTSILERLSLPLCDQLLSVESQRQSPDSSSTLLDGIERANLFLISLDNQRIWYRYHHLFAELLQHRLQHERGDEFISALHRAASNWFEAQGYLLEAARHAFQTRDWSYAADLVERHAMTLITRSQMTILLDWYKQLPVDVLYARPLACIYMAWALMLYFREDYRPTVEEWVARTEHALLNDKLPVTVRIGLESTEVNLQELIRGQICVIRSQNLLASFQEPVDPQTLIDLSQRALELLPPIAGAERSVCVINLALAHLALGEAMEAEPVLARAQRLMMDVGNHFGVATTVWYQARLAFYTGQISRTYELCLQNYDRMHSIFQAPAREFPAIHSISVAEAMVRLEQNHLEQAEALLNQALNQTGWATWVELWAFASLVRLQQALEDSTGALQTLERMERMGPQHAVCAQALRTLHHLRYSPAEPRWCEWAELWAHEHQPDLETYGIVLGLGPYHCDALYIKDLTWAHIKVALGQPGPALAFVEPTLAVARQHKLLYRIVELSVLRAMAQSAAGDLPGALDTLQEALRLGIPHRYIRVFDQGRALDSLLAKVARREGAIEFVRHLAAEFKRPELLHELTSTRHQEPQPSMIEPLSQRELEVLRLIATGYSNADIAAQLFIAFGTVKRHINNIYGKLGVESRTQAVDKARHLGLLL